MEEIDLILISKTYNVDEIGQRIPTETSRTVPATRSKVNRNEWNAAGQRGIKAECVVYTSALNYEDEELAEIEGIRYIIYRSFIKPSQADEIELYLKKEVI